MNAVNELGDLPLLAVALDVSELSEALRLARAVADHVDIFKVGLELFWRDGLDAIFDVAALGKPVFADAKLHDIPHTVQAAARNLSQLPVAMFTVHLAGGRAMIEAALSGAAAGAASMARARPLVLGVTVLTSHSAASVAGTGIMGSTNELVAELAATGSQAGIDGLVCSPLDLPVVSEVAPEMLWVTPGIRAHLASGPADDQARVATPKEAFARGADILVVGRPITQAVDPTHAAACIHREVIALREGAS